MSTFGDIERTFADLYPYRWAIGAGVGVFIAAVIAFGFWRNWHHVILRNRYLVGTIAVPLLALNIWLGWSLASPLFTNVTVDEEFPFAANASIPPNMVIAEVEEIMASASKLVLEESEAMLSGSEMANRSGTPILNGGLSVSGQSMLEEGLGMMSVAREDMDSEMMAKGIEMMKDAIAGSSGGEPINQEVMKLRTGDFKDADAFHRGSGRATIYSGPGGSYVLRLEDLDVTNGPALHVYLSPHNDPARSGEVKLPGYLDLGRLKGNRGNQNYEIPAGTDISTFNSVVIYCKPFSVVFSVAPL